MSLEMIPRHSESIELLLKQKIILQKEILSFNDVMFILGISRTSLYRMLRKKKIPAYKPLEGKIFFNCKEFKRWLFSPRHSLNNFMEPSGDPKKKQYSKER